MLRLVSCIDFFSVNKCYNYFVVKKVIIGLRVSTIAVLVFILSKLLKLIIHNPWRDQPTQQLNKITQQLLHNEFLTFLAYVV